MQPSGKAHIGNYLGAMRQHVSMQDTHECIYFLANMHALTTIRDGETLRQLTLDLAADYLALGIDPKKTIFFRQSDVPEHTELTWIFDCITPMGLLQRAHAWKDAQNKGMKDSTVGLFNYPVLMAVDILIYKPDLVPVGKDQKQHIEIARDIAATFNHHFGETFPLPEDVIKDEVSVVPGTDGQKMSKSYGNTIDIFADEKTLKKQVMGIVTDSKSVDEAKDPKQCNVFALYKHFATKNEAEELKDKYISGGFGYGEAKKLLLKKLLQHFEEPRKKRIELSGNFAYVLDVLDEGAKRARAIASETMEEVRTKIGTK